MADRIIKGDSGNDVIIQNNDASRKIEVTNSGDVEVTGDVKTTTVKATNLKANDGTAGLVVADSTGEVTSSGGLKAVNVKATNIKANDGSAGLVIADSSGAMTASGGIADAGTITAGTIGSGVTGQNRPYFYCESYNGDPAISTTTELTDWIEGANGDPDSKFSTTTGRFTPGVAGIYVFGARIFIQAAASSFARVYIRYNDGSSDSDVYSQVDNEDEGSIDITRMIYMNATGYASVLAQFHSLNRNLLGAACQFWGMRIA
tara:strand:- start:167 stop:949 length:783 start_codon:yes stop_codon:yes gene_type:complete